jgi:hypothetical protein
MAVLELVNQRPDWMNALGVALTLPAGVKQDRRSGDDPWEAEATDRPRRVSDDLAWLRQAMDEPQQNGLRDMGDTAAVGAWIPEGDAHRRLERLRDRRVLDAAGFLLHEDALSGQALT